MKPAPPVTRALGTCRRAYRAPRPASPSAWRAPRRAAGRAGRAACAAQQLAPARVRPAGAHVAWASWKRSSTTRLACARPACSGGERGLRRRRARTRRPGRVDRERVEPPGPAQVGPVRRSGARREPRRHEQDERRPRRPAPRRRARPGAAAAAARLRRRQRRAAGRPARPQAGNDQSPVHGRVGEQVGAAAERGGRRRVPRARAPDERQQERHERDGEQHEADDPVLAERVELERVRPRRRVRAVALDQVGRRRSRARRCRRRGWSRELVQRDAPEVVAVRAELRKWLEAEFVGWCLNARHSSPRSTRVEHDDGAGDDRGQPPSTPTATPASRRARGPSSSRRSASA